MNQTDLKSYLTYLDMIAENDVQEAFNKALKYPSDEYFTLSLAFALRKRRIVRKIVSDIYAILEMSHD